MEFSKITGLKGEITVPGDKSISHRAVMLGSLAKGTTEVVNCLQGADCLSTMDCFKKMGVSIENNGNTVLIKGNGLHSLKTPSFALDAGNSGTAIRLMSGILAAQNFNSAIDGDESIRTRPMKRIITPLSMMGAEIISKYNNDCAPLLINGKKLNSIHYNSPVASAQVKSSILFAGLYAEGETKVTEPYLSRNHTELMFKYFGIDVDSHGTTATVRTADEFEGRKVIVPGDLSSAAYFIVAGLITPDSEICIKNVGINSTRDGIIDVVKMMGGSIEIFNERCDGGETTADILVRTSRLHGITIGGEIIPKLIDEIPIICILACFADGTTVIKDAAELKVKESNRIDAMVDNLKLMNADVTATDDGMIINGGVALCGAEIDSKKDHRIAMSFTIAGINAKERTKIKDSHCVNISYPGFYDDLKSLL